MVSTRHGTDTLKSKDTKHSNDASRKPNTSDSKVAKGNLAKKESQPDKTAAGKTGNPAASSKKRKAFDIPNDDEDKENKENKQNANPRVTPPPAKSPAQTKPVESQTTPGRIGPIKPEANFDLSPEIKPFKGPKGKKVRKTFQEKEDEYRQFGLENEGHCFHELYVCHHKGPNGSPTYDKQGFQLDYDKVAKWMQPQAYNKSAIMNGMEGSLKKGQSDAEQMRDIFFEKGINMPSTDNVDYWKDRVSKDLWVPWHRIGVEHFKEWEKRGFEKAKSDVIVSEEQRRRMLDLYSGASLRK